MVEAYKYFTPSQEPLVIHTYVRTSNIHKVMQCTLRKQQARNIMMSNAGVQYTHTAQAVLKSSAREQYTHTAQAVLKPTVLY